MKRPRRHSLRQQRPAFFSISRNAVSSCSAWEIEPLPVAARVRGVRRTGATVKRGRETDGQDGQGGERRQVEIEVLDAVLLMVVPMAFGADSDERAVHTVVDVAVFMAHRRNRIVDLPRGSGALFYGQNRAIPTAAVVGYPVLSTGCHRKTTW